MLSGANIAMSFAHNRSEAHENVIRKGTQGE